MKASEKQWFVMRDLKRRTANVLAIHELADAGLEVFSPMKQMIMTIGGRKQRRDVPVIQDLLFVYETKDKLDLIVSKLPTLQYRYVLGRTKNEPMTVRKEDMDRFIFAVKNTTTPIYYKSGELTRSMYGKTIRIMDGMFSGYEGRLLSVKGMRKRRIIIEIPNLVAAAIEINPDFIQFV